MRINGKVYFDPWVGDNYKDGIKGDKILVIGLQHWCDPKYWNCDKDPHKCLDERDSTCTVWNAECYRPKNSDKNLDENAQKPSGWEHLGEKNDMMPNCPILEECNKRNECNGTKDNTPRLRYLHCETKISVYDHINGQERAQRASIFGAVLAALEELYSIKFENKEANISYDKKKCWNSIAFTNFIQHYTKIDSKNPNRININHELTKVLSEKNSEALEYLISDSKKKHKYLKGTPSVIIALNINKKTMSIIKGICGKDYVECENIPIMTPMGGTFAFTVFALRDSFLYKKIKNDLEAFVDNYVIENLQVDMDRKDLKITKSEIARKIQALAEFLKEQKELEDKKVSKYRNDILKNNNTHKSIRGVFYSDKDNEKQKISMFTEIRKSEVKHLLNNEIDGIKAAYEDFKEKRRNI